MTRGGGILALLVALLSGPSALAKDKRDSATPDTPLPSGVSIEQVEGMTRIDAVVPGWLIDFTVAKLSNGERTVVLLVQPREFDNSEEAKEEPAESDTAAADEDGEERRIPDCPDESDAGEADAEPARRLYSLPPAGEGDLVLIRDDLPSDTQSLDAADIDGDGQDELLLDREGELLMVELGGTTAKARTLLSDPGLPAARVGHNTTSGGSPGSVVTVVQLGSLRLFGPGGSEPGWHLLADVELPLEGSARGNRIEVRSAVPSFVGRREDGTLLFATRPRAWIGRRLQVQLIQVGTSGEATVTDCWAALPEAEDVLESFFLMLDDRPSLLVTTKPAGKLGLFGEKRLRLYRLERDRSRLGITPLLATQSRMNLWQNSVPRLHDVNGDAAASPTTTNTVARPEATATAMLCARSRP